jgi:hypothetical protein
MFAMRHPTSARRPKGSTPDVNWKNASAASPGSAMGHGSLWLPW